MELFVEKMWVGVGVLMYLKYCGNRDIWINVVKKIDSGYGRMEYLKLRF